MVTLKIPSLVFYWKLVTQQRRGLKTVIISEGLQNKLSCWAGGESVGVWKFVLLVTPSPSLPSFTSEEYWLTLSKDFKINWSIKKLNKELIKRKLPSFYNLSALPGCWSDLPHQTSHEQQAKERHLTDISESCRLPPNLMFSWWCRPIRNRVTFISQPEPVSSRRQQPASSCAPSSLSSEFIPFNALIAEYNDSVYSQDECTALLTSVGSDSIVSYYTFSQVVTSTQLTLNNFFLLCL